jgi:hypothetical protein
MNEKEQLKDLIRQLMLMKLNGIKRSSKSTKIVDLEPLNNSKKPKFEH